MKTNQIISVVVLVIIASAASFFAGTKYQQTKVVSNFRQQAIDGTGLGQGMGRGTNNATANTDGTKNRGQTPGFRQTVGEIINLDNKSMTVKLIDGSSKIVLFSDSTTISQSTDAAKTDLKVGTKVAVQGDQNTDGSVTSRNIEINPHIATVTPAK